MIQKYKFVEKNIVMLRELTKNGYVSPKLIVYYHIYKSYMDVKKEPKMARYQIVSKEINTSVSTVRRAVSEMKKYVKD